MKYPVVITGVLAIVIGLAAYGLVTGNSTIHAKPEQQPNNLLNNHPAKLVIIKANDGARHTFIVTQEYFTGIDSGLIFSSANTNFPVNATLDNIASFVLAHSGPPPT